MVERISNKLLNIITNNENTEEEKEILLFGITRIVEDIPKTIGIVLIGIFLGIFKEILIVTLIIAIYKTFLGGVHAKTNIGCFIYSVMFYLVTIYSARYLAFSSNIEWLIFAIIYIFSVYTILMYAPADVPEIPKVDKKLRKTLKIKSFISLNLIYLFSIFFIKVESIRTLIIYSIFYISLMTTRTIYKLFKNKYGYEDYVPEELL